MEQSQTSKYKDDSKDILKKMLKLPLDSFGQNSNRDLLQSRRSQTSRSSRSYMQETKSSEAKKFGKDPKSVSKPKGSTALNRNSISSLPREARISSQQDKIFMVQRNQSVSCLDQYSKQRDSKIPLPSFCGQVSHRDTTNDRDKDSDSFKSPNIKKSQSDVISYMRQRSALQDRDSQYSVDEQSQLNSQNSAQEGQESVQSDTASSYYTPFNNNQKRQQNNSANLLKESNYNRSEYNKKNSKHELPKPWHNSKWKLQDSSLQDVENLDKPRIYNRFDTPNYYTAPSSQSFKASKNHYKQNQSIQQQSIFNQSQSLSSSDKIEQLQALNEEDEASPMPSSRTRITHGAAQNPSHAKDNKDIDSNNDYNKIVCNNFNNNSNNDRKYNCDNNSNNSNNDNIGQVSRQSIGSKQHDSNSSSSNNNDHQISHRSTGSKLNLNHKLESVTKAFPRLSHPQPRPYGHGHGELSVGSVGSTANDKTLLNGQDEKVLSKRSLNEKTQNSSYDLGNYNQPTLVSSPKHDTVHKHLNQLYDRSIELSSSSIQMPANEESSKFKARTSFVDLDQYLSRVQRANSNRDVQYALLIEQLKQLSQAYQNLQNEQASLQSQNYVALESKNITQQALNEATQKQLQFQLQVLTLQKQAQDQQGRYDEQLKITHMEQEQQLEQYESKSRKQDTNLQSQQEQIQELKSQCDDLIQQIQILNQQIQELTGENGIQRDLKLDYDQLYDKLQKYSCGDDKEHANMILTQVKQSMEEKQKYWLEAFHDIQKEVKINLDNDSSHKDRQIEELKQNQLSFSLQLREYELKVLQLSDDLQNKDRVIESVSNKHSSLYLIYQNLQHDLKLNKLELIDTKNKSIDKQAELEELKKGYRIFQERNQFINSSKRDQGSQKGSNSSNSKSTNMQELLLKEDANEERPRRSLGSTEQELVGQQSLINKEERMGARSRVVNALQVPLLLSAGVLLSRIQPFNKLGRK